MALNWKSERRGEEWRAHPYVIERFEIMRDAKWTGEYLFSLHLVRPRPGGGEIRELLRTRLISVERAKQVAENHLKREKGAA